MNTNRMAVLAKHFGAPDGDWNAWTREKRRAFGFGYLASALLLLQQHRPDEAWRTLSTAVSVWPGLLGRLDTFYELACGDQPRGYRGQADLLDVGRNGTEMLRRLDDLFARLGPALEPRRRTAYGSGYLALAMLSDQAGRRDEARRYLLRAVGINPMLLVSYPVVRRLVKLCVRPRLVCLGHLLVRARQPTA
jgi:tetratricopeptide (TPR) repeat protein